MQLEKGSVKEVTSFTYLGCIVSTSGDTDDDVKARVAKARAALDILQKLPGKKQLTVKGKLREIATSTKLHVFSTNVKTVLLYAAETWRRELLRLCWENYT